MSFKASTPWLGGSDGRSIGFSLLLGNACSAAAIRLSEEHCRKQQEEVDNNNNNEEEGLLRSGVTWIQEREKKEKRDRKRERE